MVLYTIAGRSICCARRCWRRSRPFLRSAISLRTAFSSWRRWRRCVCCCSAGWSCSPDSCSGRWADWRGIFCANTNYNVRAAPLPLCRSTANKRYTDFRPFGGGVNSPCRNAEGTAFPPLPQSPDDAAARPFERRAGEHFSEVKTIKKVIRFLYDIVQYFIRKFDEHAVGAFSAQASFFTIISFSPSLCC